MSVRGAQPQSTGSPGVAAGPTHPSIRLKWIIPPPASLGKWEWRTLSGFFRFLPPRSLAVPHTLRRPNPPEPTFRVCFRGLGLFSQARLSFWGVSGVVCVCCFGVVWGLLRSAGCVDSTYSCGEGRASTRPTEAGTTAGLTRGFGHRPRARPYLVQRATILAQSV